MRWFGLIAILLIILITIVAHSNGHVFVKKVYDVFMNLNEDKNNY